MVPTEQLVQLKGQLVRLAFNDGLVIRGRLITVDPDRVADQVIYEVQAIEEGARGSRPELRVGGVYASNTDEIVSIEKM